MGVIEFVFILIVVIGLIVSFGRSVKNHDGHRHSAAFDWSPGLPYEKVTSLLSPAERSLYGVIQSIADADNLVLLAKVRLADVVKVTASGRGYYTHLNKVTRKHLDFLMCDRLTLRPLLAIELDDASHQRADRQMRDLDVNAILAAADLPILHVTARAAYVQSELASLIRSELHQSRWVDRMGANSGYASASGITSRPHQSNNPIGQRIADSSLRCPRCGSGLIEQLNHHTGEHFWACREFPRCHYTRAMSRTIKSAIP